MVRAQLAVLAAQTSRLGTASTRPAPGVFFGGGGAKLADHPSEADLLLHARLQVAVKAAVPLRLSVVVEAALLLLGAMVACGSPFGRVGLRFVDGHQDAWDPWAWPTGEAADSELGLALGRHRDALPEPLASQLPVLDPADVAVLGARDADELAAYGQSSLAGEVLLRPEELREEGVAAATRRAVEAVAAQRPWWPHVDLDVLATDQLAAVGYPRTAASPGSSWPVWSK